MGGYLLQHWKIKCNDKIFERRIPNFMKSSKTNCPTGNTRGTREQRTHLLPRTVLCTLKQVVIFNNYGQNIFVSFEKTGNIQSSNNFFAINLQTLLAISDQWEDFEFTYC